MTTATNPRTLLEEILEGEPLSGRELEILAGIAAGETKHDTAARLWLAPETIHTYRKRILAKLAARNAPHAVSIAYKRGLLGA